MYGARIAFLCSVAGLFGAQSAPGQAHGGHRHPSGVKILIGGTLVEPVCRFARQLSGGALTRCAEQQGTRASLVLLSSDSALYLLATDAMNDDAVAAARKLIGQEVRVNGTVFRAANGYVILLDSLWVQR